jgi:hypothetical protein
LALASGFSQESRLGLDVDDVNKTKEPGWIPFEIPKEKNSNPNRADV